MNKPVYHYPPALMKTAEACRYIAISSEQLAMHRELRDIRPVMFGTRDLRYRTRDLETLAELLAEGKTKWQQAVGKVAS